MKKLKDIKYNLKNSHLLIVFMLIGFIVFILQQSDNSNLKSDQKTETSDGVDTFIPQGYVLIPLEISNLESLQGLLSDKGVVDLYFLTDGRSIKIGSRLKMIRAPLNPRLFAVLVKENESASILKYPGPFNAVVQNTKVTDGRVFSEARVQNKFKVESSVDSL